MANRNAPSPEFEAQATETQPEPADIPRGELGPLNEVAAEPTDDVGIVDLPELEEGEEDIEGDFDDLPLEEDLGPLSEDEELLFGPTDFPEEPADTGADRPFRRSVFEDDRDYIVRVATKLSQSPSATDETRAFLERVVRGE